MKVALPVMLMLLLLVSFPSPAAEKEVALYNRRIWQSDEGLPLDAAQSIAQTPDGFLWVGTKGGLARFDGMHFDIIDSQLAPGLAGANIIGLHVTRDGCLWVATRGGGMQRFEHGHFQHFGRNEGLAGDDCLGPIFEDSTGAMWVGTLEGLSRFQDGKFSIAGKKQVRAICQDHAGNLWFGTATGLDVWSNGCFIRHLGRESGLHNMDVRTVMCDSDGTIWFGSGAEVYRIKDDKVESVVQWEGPNYNLISVLYQDQRGNYWAGTYGGLNRIINKKFVPVLNTDGLPYGTVMAIFEDRENNLWACAKDGLLRLKPNRVLCYTEQQGLSNDNVSSVLEDDSGAICIGTWGGGLNRLQNGVITTYTNRNGFPLLVLGLHEDRRNHLWVGTDFNEGLYELNGKSVKHFLEQGGDLIPAVRLVFEDREGNMWVGTSKGLYQMHDGKLRLQGEKEGLAEAVIRDMIQDHAGTLWIATQTGLVRCRNGAFDCWTRKNGLPADFLMTVFEDRERTLWIGTLGHGLTRYRNGCFTTYTAKSGLFSDNIFSILEDDNDWLWMASDRGIFRVKRKNFDEFDHHTLAGIRSIAYGKTDGMVNRICNNVARPSAWKARDGRLWFATIKGLCVVDPTKEIFPEASPPPVVIEQVVAEHRTIDDLPGEDAPIRIQPGTGELEFRYAALGFRAPEENRYKYKLEGLDSDWIDADHRQIAHYDNIRPGRYQFRVVACNSDNVWNATGATVVVVLLPHFWQRWWFWPAVLALSAGAMFVLGTVLLQRRKEIELLRARLAADLHDEVGSNLASIALLSQLGQKASDKGPPAELSEINRVALATVNSIREIVWLINPDYDSMPQLIVRMRQAADQLLSGLHYTFDSPDKPAQRKLSLLFRRNVYLIFKEILHNIAKHARAARVEIVLRETDGRLQLRVTDDGRGFSDTAPTRGAGLHNMRRRASQLGGTIEISTPHHGGVRVSVEVRIT